MPCFIILGKLSERALGRMKEAKDRDFQIKKVIEDSGGTLVSHYYTIGRYDVVMTINLPSEEILAKVLIGIGKFGTVSTETMTALLPEQMYRMATGT